MNQVGLRRNLTSDEKFRLDFYLRELEREEFNRATISANIAAIYKDAKEHGFDTKALRALARLRNMEKGGAHCVALDAYMQALGDFSNTPLGQAMQGRQQHPGEDGNPYD